MSRVSHSAAMTAATDVAARAHLLRPDQQEDICFGLWRPSRGASRFTAILEKLILPREGERNVHGNASLEPAFLERALSEAAAAGAGLALLHSHPFGTGWQGMSKDDIRTEQGMAGAIFGGTGLPLVGFTLAGDGTWSARFWERTAPKTYPGAWCGTVRVVGDSLKVSYMEDLAPIPQQTDEQIRTVSAWGAQAQADLTRLRVGVVGAGSVGGFILDSLARTGFEDIMPIDFDKIEKHNLDRLCYATRDDIGELKVNILAGHLEKRATAANCRIEPVVGAIYEEDTFRKALDCDVLFSCVDRPWGRHVLNFIAYAHLIPVIDGGIRVRTTRSGKLAAADWRASTATIGRACLQCVGQYDPGLVQTEREGHLDSPSYIEGLPDYHPLHSRQNVYTFSMSCAGMQMLQMLALVLSPCDQPDPGEQVYRFVGGTMDVPKFRTCHPECVFRSIIARGDTTGIKITK
jgi:hypothetical protein